MPNEIVTAETQVPISPKTVNPNRMGRYFAPGNNANPKGRPKGSPDIRLLLLKALAKVEKEKGITFAEHFVTEAFKSDCKQPVIMVALARKLWADRVEEMGEKAPSVINVNRIYVGGSLGSNGEYGSVRNDERAGQLSAPNPAPNP